MTAVVLTVISVLIAISLPMAMGKVRPNGWYGCRTRKTMSDTRVWYEANRRAGINLIVANLSALMFWGVMRAIAGVQKADVLTVPAMLVLVLAASGVSLFQLRKM